MAQYKKGEETRGTILHTARRLFYEQGYEATTTRQIAEASGANLGLIKYYFESKAEMARLIYLDIRDSFTDGLAARGYEGEALYLLSSAVELKLCCTCAAFGRFYHEIYKEEKIRSLFQEKITDTLNRTRAYAHESEDYYTFACISIAAMKPALVSYFMEHPEAYPAESYIRYYMEQQVHFYHYDPGLVPKCLMELQKYYFNTVDHFTPVIVELKR